MEDMMTDEVEAIFERIYQKLTKLNRVYVYTAWARPEVIVLKPEAGTGRHEHVQERLDVVDSTGNVVYFWEYANRTKRKRHSAVCPDDGNECW